MENLFTKGKLEQVEQIYIFLSLLRPKIKKMCVMKGYANFEAIFNVALEVEKVLTWLGETPFELLKEKQEENMIVGETTIDNKYNCWMNDWSIYWEGRLRFKLNLNLFQEFPLISMNAKFVKQNTILLQIVQNMLPLDQSV